MISNHNVGVFGLCAGGTMAGSEHKTIPYDPLNTVSTVVGYVDLAHAGVLVLVDGKLKPSFRKAKDAGELLAYQEVFAKWVFASDAAAIAAWMGAGPQTDAVDAALDRLSASNPFLYNLALSKGWDAQGGAELSVNANKLQDIKTAIEMVAQPVVWVAQQGVSLYQATKHGVKESVEDLSAIAKAMPLILGGLAVVAALVLYSKVK